MREPAEDPLQHYSKRPPPAEPLPLGTGDFEAVGYEVIPPPPRAPVFHRSMAQQPQGFGFGHGRYPAHYSQVPAAPHSLSPVAMSSVRSANATGPQRAQQTVVIRSRPTVKMGVSILVAGALIGGVFGVGMRARQNEAAAAFAAQLQEEEQQQALATPPPQAPVSPVVMNNPNAGPMTLPQTSTALPANAYAGVPFGSLVVAPAVAPSPAPPTPQRPAAVVVPVAAAPVVVAPAPAPVAAAPKAAPQKHAAWWGKPAGGGHPSLSAKVTSPPKDKDDGYKVASANNEEPPAPKASSKPAKEPAAAKDEPKETKKAAKGGGSKASDDADKVLRAAMGATENTL